MTGELSLRNELDITGELCSMEPTYYDFGLSLYIDLERPIEEQLKNQEILLSGINGHIDFLYNYEPNEVKEIATYEYLRDNIGNLFNEIEFICLCFKDVDLIQIIKNNAIIQTKKIVIPERIEINEYDKLINLLTIYSEYKDNIYVSMANNTFYVSLTECLNIVTKIKTIAENIQILNLSPIETIMYTYDLVRNRVYKFEDQDELPATSRDLSSVLFGDKIVCAGYSNIFSALLNYMGIKCHKVGMLAENNNQTDRHERNLIYVKDDKYDIDGVYYFDTTWDSKRENENNEFLNRYKYFAKTLSQMNELEKNKYIYDDMPYLGSNIVPIIEKHLNYNELAEINSKYFVTINYITRMATGKNALEWGSLIPGAPEYNKFNKSKLLKKLRDGIEKFNKPIPAETFIEILSNVRKVQYYQNPNFYPYSLNDIYKTYVSSNWEFDEHYYSLEQQLLMKIFGCNQEEYNVDRDNRREDFINYNHSTELGKEIKAVQLTKLLRNYYNSKKDC